MTATPEKSKLEDKKRRRLEREAKEERKNLNKQGASKDKALRKSNRPTSNSQTLKTKSGGSSAPKKQVEKKMNTKKNQKRMKKNNDDENNQSEEMEEECFVCQEFGKTENWYRCTSCGRWVHAACSGWDSPLGYQCDFCEE